ncbi:uncharacterized protein LOC110920105 [Helianthus annuus]|uniref:uncharacterized protein LOC110920105 n=1 Tax=Helianthus annuus TaxID=4232 RepID=UPI000B900BF8|nr:uncharacterized protein LOC110920105 [Helianthus annuus]
MVESHDPVHRESVLYNKKWYKFVDLIKETYFPPYEVEKVESDFLTLSIKNLDCRKYVSDYNSLSRLVPYLITPESKRIACFSSGLAPEIKGMVKASKPTTFRSAINLSLSLTQDEARFKPKKGKFGFDKNQQRSDDRPVCKTCGRRHWGQCQTNQQSKQCGICKKTGHQSHECRDLKNVVCFGCGEKGHIKTNCPKRATEGNVKPREAKKPNARAFQLTAREAVNDANVITGTFLVNDIFARVLFDSVADKSFVDHKFSKLLNLPLRALDINYEVEMADGSIEIASTILDGCVISIKNIPISVNLLPINLAGFDIVLGMDWLAHNQARISCDKKLIEIKSMSDEVLTIRGDQHYGLPEKVSLLKASKYFKGGCVIYMAQMTIDDPKPKIEDIQVISEYPDVFPEDLPSLPPERQVEFRIDILPGSTPVARAPYQLAPTEMKELKAQLDELLEKGFIQPSSSS